MDRRILKSKRLAAALVTTAVVAASMMPGVAQAATLTSSKLVLGDPRPNQTTVSYTWDVASATVATTVRCIRVEFDNTDGAGSGTKPAGMNVTSLGVSASSTLLNPSAWTVTNDNVNGVSTIANATGATPAASGNLIFTGITNGTTAETTYWALLNTYSDQGCTTAVDSTVVAYVFSNGQAVSVTVDPSLMFTIAGAASGTVCNGATSNQTTTGATVPLGRVSTSTNRIGVQNLAVTTNAAMGYTVLTRSTGVLTYSTANIDDHLGTNATPTVFPAAGALEAFGYTTNEAALGTGTANRFTSGGAKWAGFTGSNLEVAYASGPVTGASGQNCIAYQAAIDGLTPAGTYLTTVIYTAAPIF